MTPFLQLALVLAVLISAAKLAGYVSYRLGQPSVLGELLVGLLLGPSLLDLFHLPLFTDAHLEETIHHLAEVGVLLLMFVAGLDLHLSDLARSGRVAALGGVLGVVAPVVLGAGVALVFGIPNEAALFVGLILAATSVSISAQTLMELGYLRSRVGISLLGAAVFDDILVVLGLSIFVAVFANGGGAVELGSILGIIGQMALFLAVGGAVGFLFVPRLAALIDRLPISQGLLALVFVTMLLYGLAAEVFGSMAAITGAFLAGLVFGRTPLKDRIEDGVAALAYGVFVPVFFVNIGLGANARALDGDTLLLMVALTVIAVISKIVGAGLGGKLGGLSNRESLQL
ncbi:MAG: cation:proton antiporter, partial [Anaerolineae bacterium]|nr:cation:proton antiporter [Anaerolineae bacterium]